MPELVDDINPRALLLRCAGAEIGDSTLGQVVASWARDFQMVAMPTAVNLNAALAEHILTMASSVMHVVPLTDKTCTRRFLQDRPSRKRYSRMRRLAAAPAPIGKRRRTQIHMQRLVQPSFAMPAAEVLDWIGASKHLLQVKDAMEATESFSHDTCHTPLRN